MILIISIIVGISLIHNVFTGVINIRKVFSGYNANYKDNIFENFGKYITYIQKKQYIYTHIYTVNEIIITIYIIRHGIGTTLKFVNKLDGSLYNVAVSYRDGYLHVLPSETPESSADEK